MVTAVIVKKKFYSEEAYQFCFSISGEVPAIGDALVNLEAGSPATTLISLM